MTGDANGKTPYITALMPLKNYHLEFLKKSVACMFSQTSPDWRLLIIVEEEDLDSFREILQEELKDSRIGMVKNEGRKLAGAYNTGMRCAETPFVAALLSDDLWSLHAVQTLTDYIEKFDTVDFFHSSRLMIDENDRPISRIFPSRRNFKLTDFITASPVKHLLCWRREKALSFGGMDETLNSVGPDDFDFPWTMAEQGAIFLAVKECLYFHRPHFEGYRLTTHLPLDLHVSETRRILTKHGVDPEQIETRIERALNTYLKQCIYKDELDKRIKETLGVPHPRIGENYH